MYLGVSTVNLGGTCINTGTPPKYLLGVNLGRGDLPSDFMRAGVEPANPNGLVGTNFPSPPLGRADIVSGLSPQI